jgi:hypothetical protein
MDKHANSSFCLVSCYVSSDKYEEPKKVVVIKKEEEKKKHRECQALS